jgi:hypothetical protein
MVTLHCKASSPEGEQPKIRWLKDGKVLQQDRLPDRYTISSTGTLDIDGEWFSLARNNVHFSSASCSSSVASKLMAVVV